MLPCFPCSWSIGQLFVDPASEESAGPGEEGVDALTNSGNVWEIILLAGTGKFTFLSSLTTEGCLILEYYWSTSKSQRCHRVFVLQHFLESVSAAVAAFVPY